MNLENTNNPIVKKLIDDDGNNVLLTESAVPLLQMMHNGELSRYEVWQVLLMIHNGEMSSNLPQYGMLTVFSLCKDMTQFGQLYDQGIAMLRENGIVTAEDDELLEREMMKEFSKKPINISIVIKKSPKKKKKNPNNNNRLN